MINLVNYLFESGVSLSLLALIYVLFLRKETFFRQNRFFLLCSILFSIVLPFLKFRVYTPHSNMLEEVTVSQYRNMLEVVTVSGQNFSGTVVQSVSSSKIIIGIYLIGMIFFLARLLFRLGQIALLIKRNEVQHVDNYGVVLIDKEFSPFSFLKYVFINPKMRTEQGYDKMIEHELVHIKQGHSFDVLVLEILTVFQWFNPFMWMLKRAIRENHEYLADNAVLRSGMSMAQYKKMLLEQVVGFQLEMTNNFNSSLIKKRIKMISKIRSSKLAKTKYVLGILSIIMLIVVFACESKQSKTIKIEDSNDRKVTFTMSNDTIRMKGDKDDLSEVYKMLSRGNNFDLKYGENGDYILVKEKPTYDDKVFFIVEKMPKFPGGDMALRKYIANSVKYPVAAQKKRVEGKVYVTFVVAKDGLVANARIARGVDPILDAEALRVVNSLPKWKPGYQQGKAVNVSYTVPINFKLQ